jgi:hypothetical protein
MGLDAEGERASPRAVKMTSKQTWNRILIPSNPVPWWIAKGLLNL